MKTILLCLLFFCAIMLPLYAQSEVDDTLKADVRVLKEDVLVLKTDFKNLKENVIAGFDRIEKNFDRQNNIIIACIGLPLAILAIVATVWAYWHIGVRSETARNAKKLRCSKQK